MMSRYSQDRRERGLLGGGYSMTKAVRHDCEILMECQIIWGEGISNIRWGVRGEDGKQVNISVGCCSLTNHAKWLKQYVFMIAYVYTGQLKNSADLGQIWLISV